MYERLNRSDDNALAYRILEPRSKPEMEMIATELEGAIAVHGDIRVLIDLQAFPYAELGSVWEELKFDIRYLRELERFALVGGDRIEERAVRIFSKLTYTRCRCFADDQLDDAWSWLLREDIYKPARSEPCFHDGAVNDSGHSCNLQRGFPC